jgi:hypothetical protein
MAFCSVSLYGAVLEKMSSEPAVLLNDTWVSEAVFAYFFAYFNLKASR